MTHLKTVVEFCRALKRSSSPENVVTFFASLPLPDDRFADIPVAVERAEQLMNDLGDGVGVFCFDVNGLPYLSYH